jgi:hypothetical protein
MKLSDLRFHLSRVSTNSKTGPIPVSTSSAATCPATCPFNNGGGCYAANYPMRHHWEAVSRGERGEPLQRFLANIAALPAGQFWRMNQAGDIPHTAGRISRRFIRGLIAANRGRRGYTYTHHRLDIGENLPLIRQANRNGLTVNISTETETAADSAIAAGLPAVLTVSSDESRTTWQTAAGNRVLVCPAQRSDTKTCADCQLCHKRGRRVIIAFLAHGTAKRKAERSLTGAAQ